MQKNITFLGRKVPDIDIKEGKISYGTLSRTFNLVLCNEIMNDRDDYDVVLGDDSIDDCTEIFQYYIIDQNGFEILEMYAPKEIVFHLNDLDIYVWGITHFGTAWDYVSTDINIDKLF